MSEYDRQRDIEAEGQRAAIYHGKQRDIASRLTSIADAGKRADGTDIPLGEQLREAAAEIRRMREALQSSLEAMVRADGRFMAPSLTHEIEQVRAALRPTPSSPEPREK